MCLRNSFLISFHQVTLVFLLTRTVVIVLNLHYLNRGGSTVSFCFLSWCFFMAPAFVLFSSIVCIAPGIISFRSLATCPRSCLEVVTIAWWISATQSEGEWTCTCFCYKNNTYKTELFENGTMSMINQNCFAPSLHSEIQSFH